MGLGTKNRQKQTADICKQHLREKYRDKLGLVEEFIVEFEGARKDQPRPTCWTRFTDIKDIKEEMLKRLEVHFEKWLNLWRSDETRPDRRRAGKRSSVQLPLETESERPACIFLITECGLTEAQEFIKARFPELQAENPEQFR